MLALCDVPLSTDHTRRELSLHLKWPSHFAEFFSPLVCLRMWIHASSPKRTESGRIALVRFSSQSISRSWMRSWRPLWQCVVCFQRAVVDLPRGVTLFPWDLEPFPPPRVRNKSMPRAQIEHYENMRLLGMLCLSIHWPARHNTKGTFSAFLVKSDTIKTVGFLGVYVRNTDYPVT